MRVPDDEAGVAIGLCLQPDQPVAVIEPSRIARSRIIGNEGRPASRYIQDTDLVRLGMRLEGIGRLGVDGEGTTRVGDGGGPSWSSEEGPGSISE